MWRFELTPTLRFYFNILYRKLGVDFFARMWTNTLPPSRCGFWSDLRDSTSEYSHPQSHPRSPGEQPGVLGSANQKSGKTIITPPSKTHVRSSRSTTPNLISHISYLISHISNLISHISYLISLISTWKDNGRAGEGVWSWTDNWREGGGRSYHEDALIMKTLLSWRRSYHEEIIEQHRGCPCDVALVM